MENFECPVVAKQMKSWFVHDFAVVCDETKVAEEVSLAAFGSAVLPKHWHFATFAEASEFARKVNGKVVPWNYSLSATWGIHIPTPEICVACPKRSI